MKYLTSLIALTLISGCVSSRESRRREFLAYKAGKSMGMLEESAECLRMEIKNRELRKSKLDLKGNPTQKGDQQ